MVNRTYKMSGEGILRSKWPDVVILEGNLTDIILDKANKTDYDKTALVSYCSFQIHSSIYNWLTVPAGCLHSTNIVFSKNLTMFLTAGVLLMEDNSL